MAGLRIGPGIELPLDFATEAWAALARRGAGKSNAGAVFVEELHRNHLPFVVIDPKGDWWGIRSSADGKEEGLAVPVFGGRHGDVPLEAGSGHLLADLILGDQESYLSCVLDISLLIITEQRRFLREFLDRLFRNKDEEHVLTLIFEEVHEYLPQVVPREARDLVNVAQRIVKQGRQRGLGVGMLSQRSAAVNKDVLTQVGALIPMWTMSPQDRAAIKGWVEVGGDAPEVLNSLHELKPGEAWLWWPEGGAQRRFKFNRRWTFDSGATPKAGKKRVMPRTLADVDLGSIKDAMAETIEKAKADDPKELRKQIAALKRELANRPDVEPERIEVPVLPPSTVEWLKVNLDKVGELDVVLREIQTQLSKLDMTQRRDPLPRRAETQFRVSPPKPSPASPTRPSMRPPSGQEGDAEIKLGKTERTLMSVLVQHGAMGNDKLALLSGYSAKASTIGVSLGKLRRMNLVEPGQPNRLTPEGEIAIQGQIEALPEGSELIDYWRGRFGKTERAVLDAMIELHPQEGTYATVAEMTGYSPTASTVGVALGKLRRVGVLEGWHLSDDFVSATGL